MLSNSFPDNDIKNCNRLLLLDIDLLRQVEYEK